MYLLAQFRVKEAYPLLFEFSSIPGEVTLDLTGDVVTEDLGKILASVACGDDSLIKRLIEGDNVNEYVRSSSLKALVIMVNEGEKTREEVIEYFSELFNYRLKRELQLLHINCIYLAKR